jgi:hypothetical protein
VGKFFRQICPLEYILNRYSLFQMKWREFFFRYAGATSHKHDDFDFSGLDHYETQGLTHKPFVYKLMGLQSFLDFILLTIISNSQCGAALSISNSA